MCSDPAPSLAQMYAHVDPKEPADCQKDFELLVELVMIQGGWRRVSATSGTQHATNLELGLPLTGERALVQVKSSLDQNTTGKITAGLIGVTGDARVFIVYHTRH
ncbi:hypothetical protein [Nitrosospira sp. Nsp1]|uniref:hypothetical protein n=1 Tax=Nitrosospira sp. Nsp1 TaxID=136547 RepID=UPI00087F1756|nr:hypothetical protein [Nitrosospira sp. Nsp1]SCX40301.1 hypothetical protein SAMN05720354_10385 [Nitrosospira sp. Nsp1]